MTALHRATALVLLGLFTSACTGGAEPTLFDVGDVAAVDPAPAPPEVRQAFETAEAYIVARGAWDDVAATELLHPNGIIIDTPMALATEQNALFRFFEAVDWRWTVTDCEQARLDGSSESPNVLRAADQPVEIICRYSSENAWSRAVGSGPIGGQFRFAVSNGLITELYHDYDVVTWENGVIGMFRAWLDTNRPDASAVVWEEEGFVRADAADRGLAQRTVPVLTPEAAEAFRALTVEFAAATP